MQDEDSGWTADEKLLRGIRVHRLAVLPVDPLRARFAAYFVVPRHQFDGGEIIQARLHRALALIALVPRRDGRAPVRVRGRSLATYAGLRATIRLCRRCID